jgi:hypothetical protein
VRDDGSAASLVAATAAVFVGSIAERARLGPRRRGWGQPESYLAVALPAAVLGQPLLGTATAAAYAVATAVLAVERLRTRSLAPH